MTNSNIAFLGEDQKKALQSFSHFLASDEKVFLLKGYAGTGKTTLLSFLLEILKEKEFASQLMAPTGRAAKIVESKLDNTCETIHKAIYNFEKLISLEEHTTIKDGSHKFCFALKSNNTASTKVIFVDESSLISDAPTGEEYLQFGSGKLLSDLVHYSRVKEAFLNTKIVFIGDPAQLPPIGMNYSPALDLRYFAENFNLIGREVLLKEVKRQSAESDILNKASTLRNSIESKNFSTFDLRSSHATILEYQDDLFLKQYHSTKGVKIIICYKNKTAAKLNKEVRQIKFPGLAEVQVNDILMVSANNYKTNLMNGEFVKVKELGEKREQRRIKVGTKEIVLKWREITLLSRKKHNEFEEVKTLFLENFLHDAELDIYLLSKALYIDFIIRNPNLKNGSVLFSEALSKDFFFNALKVRFGYAVTCHKAQGGEWDNAFIFWEHQNQQNSNNSIKNIDFYRWAYTAITRASKTLHLFRSPHFNPFSEMYFDEKMLKIENRTATEKLVIDPIELGEALLHFQLEQETITVQTHFLQHFFCLKGTSIKLSNYQRKNYEVNYHFTRDDEKLCLQYWLKGSGAFGSKMQINPQQSNSTQLQKEVLSLYQNFNHYLPIKEQNSNNSKRLESYEYNTDNQNLSSLFQYLKNKLDSDTLIVGIEHLPYCERYQFQIQGELAICDFSYTSSGSFTRIYANPKYPAYLPLMLQLKGIFCAPQ